MKLGRNKVSITSQSLNQFNGPKESQRDSKQPSNRRYSTAGRMSPRKGSMSQRSKDILNPMDIWKNSLRKEAPIRYRSVC